MNTTDALKLLRDTMDEFGLEHVGAVMNGRLTSTFGRYRYSRIHCEKSIELSSKMVEVNNEKRVMRTILHEIAHALTEGHKHDAVWKAKCIQIGGDGISQYSGFDTNAVARVERERKLYTLECQKCGLSGGRRYQRVNNRLHRVCGGNIISIRIG